MSKFPIDNWIIENICMREEICWIGAKNGCAIPVIHSTTNIITPTESTTTPTNFSNKCNFSETGNQRCEGETGFSTCDHSMNKQTNKIFELNFKRFKFFSIFF